MRHARTRSHERTGMRGRAAEGPAVAPERPGTLGWLHHFGSVMLLGALLPLSADALGDESRRVLLTDHNGARIEVRLTGPGAAAISQDTGEPARIVLSGTDSSSKLRIRALEHEAKGPAVIDGISGGTLGLLSLQGVTLEGGASLESIDEVRVHGALEASTLRIAQGLGTLRVSGDICAGTFVAVGGQMGSLIVGGSVRDSTILVGAEPLASDRTSISHHLHGYRFGVSRIDTVQVRGDVSDSIISAGGDPGSDGLFASGEVLAGSSIGDLSIGGLVIGDRSQHLNPGIYTGRIDAAQADGMDLTELLRHGKSVAPGRFGVLGRGVIDPLPGAGTALTEDDVKTVLEQAIARATQLGVNATIALVDREGTILAAVRTSIGGLAPDAGVSTIDGGGAGGLEGVALPSSIFAATKAGTAAFLSTSGNAFTTRTAGFIIQQNFPANIRDRNSGPLFGVQLSSLPTSDVNRLPLGLAGDPGGVPLYRNGQVVAGIGVELDGRYTAPGSRLGSNKATLEEHIAVAGQAGFEPPKQIRADNILVDGIRFASQNVKAPKVSSLGALPDFDTLAGSGQLDVLVAPRISNPTKFTTINAGGFTFETVTDFQSDRHSAIAVTSAGGGSLAYTARENAQREVEIIRINLATDAVDVLANVSNGGANELTPGHIISALALDENGTPGNAADDTLYLFNSTNATVSAFSLGAQTMAGAQALANPDAVLRDAVYFNDSGSDTIVGISDVTGQLFKISTAGFTNAGGFTALTTAAGGRVQSFAIGEGGIFAVRETGAERDLIRVTPAGAVTTISRLSDSGVNGINPGLGILALAYDNNGTIADTTDDTLIAQSSNEGVQLVIDTDNGAIGAPGVTLATADASLAQARFVSIGGVDHYTGISRLSGQVYRVRADDVTQAANLDRLTTPNTTDFVRAGNFADDLGNERLTTDEVQAILLAAHQRNSELRAAIRKDRPQVSQVSVSVVDNDGNLLGVYRTTDAPVFGFDVSTQKARSAALFSRPDAGTLLSTADGGAYAQFVNRAAGFGINMDGAIAFSDRAIGFLARPLFPDGISSNPPGPFSTATREAFSPFSTGLQTQLIVPKIVEFITTFAGVGDEGLALTLFQQGLIGGGGVADRSLGLASGLQIFPGSVPLYKNGVLVGAVGVSGDGIEQDDAIAFAGGLNFQQFGAGVRRADEVSIDGIRLPYVKFPRRPTGGF